MTDGINRKQNFVWNMIGSIFESALNFVLLIAVNRISGESAGGIFTLSFSHAQLMYYLGTLEVRPIHSTDVKQKYRFADYFSLRLVSCVIMILACLGYVLLMDGDPVKKRFMMCMCVYKMLDAVYDLYASMFQQHDRIAFSGQVSTVRVGCVLAAFIGTLLLTGNLEWAGLAMVVTSLIVLLTFNLWKARQFSDADVQLQFSHAGEILKSCFPLFVSVFVMLYISNAPKYAINTWCTEVIQNRYSILFMPAFAINLFSQFVMRPMLTPMAKLWNEKKKDLFQQSMLKMILLIVGITAAGMAGAWLLGIPVLKLLYGVDLSADRMILLWVMLYGGLNAVNIYLYDMIAVTRSQKWLLPAYLAAAVLIFFLAPAWVSRYEMSGAIWSSIAALGLLDLGLAVILFCVLRRAPSAGRK